MHFLSPIERATELQRLDFQPGGLDAPIKFARLDPQVQFLVEAAKHLLGLAQRGRKFSQPARSLSRRLLYRYAAHPTPQHENSSLREVNGTSMGPVHSGAEIV